MANEKKTANLDRDPVWYKNAVIYQLHVRAFHDSNADGIGDFKGLTQKLDYLQHLGITAVWLLPFYPSPLRDDGYDIADYYSIHPSYGTLADFKLFLREAHARGLRVITEVVINHTSDQHPWFQKSRRAKQGDPWRDYYVWSETASEYKEARIIFKDFEVSNWTWDPIANAHFWHRFYSHQPDLNFDNPQVHRELLKVIDFWLDMGVDGLRLDAVPYLYEREGTNCENLPETHAFLKKLRLYVDENYEDKMLLAEANQWPEDAVAYFGGGRGDECHMAFHFPLMPRLFMSVRMEDRVPIVDILQQTPAIPETCQWALFLRNHDELTLEMVTDEERDYMYRVYATDPRARINLGIRRRLAPLLGNDRKRVELLNALLFSLPGTPIVYYGDEIGLGENIYLGDRNGVRTPMHWSSDKNAGFSRANPQALYLPIIVDPEYHYESVNVEAKLLNPHSLLWWMKRIITMRSRFRPLGQGTMEFLDPDNRKVLAFIRRYETEAILVVANLSRFVQPVELDLAQFRRCVPVELFGQTEFPPVGDSPYFLTLGPHGFYWFALEQREKQLTVAEGGDWPPRIAAGKSWEGILDDKGWKKLEPVLVDYFKQRRWFGGKARAVKSAELIEALPLPVENGRAQLAFVRIDYAQGDPENYLLPLAAAGPDAAGPLLQDGRAFVIARLAIEGAEDVLLYDAVADKGFSSALFDLMSRKKTLRGRRGDLTGSSTPFLKRALQGVEGRLDPVVGRAEQSNSAILFGDRLILKLFRRIEPGLNPDIEIGRFLTERQFPFVPQMGGALEYKSGAGESFSVGIMNEFIPNARDAWEHTLDTLGRYYDRVQTKSLEITPPPPVQGSFIELARLDPPELAPELIGLYLESARLLGHRTAALHVALASDPENKDFAGEPFTPHYQRSLYQSMRNLAVQNLKLLRKRIQDLPSWVQPEAQQVAGFEQEILNRYHVLIDAKVAAMRIRHHGDFHLGQVLYTGKDFVIIDFEGEPARALSERRIKRSPLRDAAGMLRSFHYAAHAGVLRQVQQGTLLQENMSHVQPWAGFWQTWVSAVYLRAYFDEAGDAPFLPKSDAERNVLMNAYVLDKAMYELGYELNNRPEWVHIPLIGILQLIQQPATA